MNYQIIDADSTHLEDITRIYNQNLGTASLYLTPRPTSYFSEIMDQLSDKERFKILLLDNEMIGWSLIQLYSPKEGYRYACETSTYIDQPHHGKGHGSFFKKEIMKECGRLGFKYILARILSENEVSIQYNVKLGYRIVGIQKKIGRVKDRWVDVTIMEYHIP
ncbi:MAG: N-acetyltransferase [Saprospiraceae bacterium]|nr:N-acetyltransferase [Saprospiraceae bacterium]